MMVIRLVNSVARDDSPLRKKIAVNNLLENNTALIVFASPSDPDIVQNRRDAQA